MPVAAHLQPGELAAFLGAGPKAADSARIQDHLAGCDECRGEAIEVARLVRAAARPGRLPRLVPLALAAGLAAVAIFRPIADPPQVLRTSEGSGGVAVLEAVAPVGPVSRAAGPVRLNWRLTGAAVEYRVTLLDATGSVLWTSVTADSVALLPVGVSLAPGADYYWYVDALLGDGTSVSSGAQRFSMTP
jgi:hypothetical protein